MTFTIFFIVTETVLCSCDTEETDTTEFLFCPGLGQAAQAGGPFRIQSQNTGIFLISFKCGWQDILQMWLAIQLWWTYIGQGNPESQSCSRDCISWYRSWKPFRIKWMLCPKFLCSSLDLRSDIPEPLQTSAQSTKAVKNAECLIPAKLKNKLDVTMHGSQNRWQSQQRYSERQWGWSAKWLHLKRNQVELWFLFFFL